MARSKRLIETKLWKVLYEKTNNMEDREILLGWVKRVYETAANHLKMVVCTFPNYTLHDEVHILNVMDAIAGVLGTRIKDLSMREAELLILASCLHDIGMVYSEQEKEHWLNNVDYSAKYIKNRSPELLGKVGKEWDSETLQQDYLRWLHPFRVKEILNREDWRSLFPNQPDPNLPKHNLSISTIIAVCEAHGETIQEIERHTGSNGVLHFSRTNDTDPLFCAVLLRLGDILDFDDSRAPTVLLDYAKKNNKSLEEWKKHIASAGFVFPETPSQNTLPYQADCYDPNEEYVVRTFLDWIDDEFSNSRALSYLFYERWRNFPFPSAVDRTEINSNGYEYGDFRLTMDQEQIISLFKGENFYIDNHVFIRELLQNSIDATLLRERMEQNNGYSFDASSEDARIDMWEWFDEEGNWWFRIDDRGTGMTRSMITNYFLKVGNSYYNSKELIRDLKEHGQKDDYKGISQFGIGFLSCFLCAKEIQVSTLYFDKAKSERENGPAEGYGIRISITGLTGIYIVKNQAMKLQDQADSMPTMPNVSLLPERNNYRCTSGTSISLRIDPNKLGLVNLKEIANSYLFYPRMPIYFNGIPLCGTLSLLKNQIEQENPYYIEMPPDGKKEFDKVFYMLKGQYPMIRRTIFPFDLNKYDLYKGISGFVCIIDVDPNPTFSLKKCSYCLQMDYNNDNKYMRIDTVIKNLPTFIKNYHKLLDLTDHTPVPTMTTPWHINFFEHMIEDFEEDPVIITQNGIRIKSSYAYMGHGYMETNPMRIAVFLSINGECRIQLNATRDEIKHIPIELTLAIAAIAEEKGYSVLLSSNGDYYSYKRWKEFLQTEAGKWIRKALSKKLDLYICNENNFSCSLLREFYHAVLMHEYNLFLTKDHKVDFRPKSNTTSDDSQWDIFPPLLYSNSIVCNEMRITTLELDNGVKILNANHPYIRWLLKNGNKIKECYPHYFDLIMNALDNEGDDECLKNLNKVRDQLTKLSNPSIANIDECPAINKSDFKFLNNSNDFLR